MDVVKIVMFCTFFLVIVLLGLTLKKYENSNEPYWGRRGWGRGWRGGWGRGWGRRGWRGDWNDNCDFNGRRLCGYGCGPCPGDLECNDIGVCV